MRATVASVISLAILFGGVHARSAEAPSSAAKSATLPFLASVARIRVEVSKKQAAVLHEVNLARGSFVGEDVELFVAFGAPGAPRAVDTRLVTVPRGHLEAPRDERGVPLVWRYATRKPSAAAALVGRSTMAGVAVSLPAELAGRAMEGGAMAALRIRAIYNLPEGGLERDLVVRLGESADGPLALGRLEVAATDDSGVTRVEARMCSETSSTPLLARTYGRATSAREGALPPVIATRKPGEDLCLRLLAQ